MISQGTIGQLPIIKVDPALERQKERGQGCVFYPSNPMRTGRNGLKQWLLTFVIRMFLNYKSQKPQPAQLVVKASGSCSPKLLSNPRLRTSRLNECEQLEAPKSVVLNLCYLDVFELQLPETPASTIGGEGFWELQSKTPE